MCNCGKNRRAARPRTYSGGTSGTSGSATQAFSLILPGKEPMSFGSRLEADAENARQGYKGIVRQNG